MAQLAPPPKFSANYIDADGNVVPAVGYRLYTYIAGTSTPKATYTNYGLGTANANPVVLDARGEASVWLDGNYKFVLKTDVDVTVWTVDEIRDLTSGQTFSGSTLAGALTVTSTAVTWSGNPTHSGNHTFTNNVSVNGNTTIGDSGADSFTINTNTATWAGNPTHSGTHTWSGSQTFSDVATFSATPAGKITSGTYTPTLFNGSNVAASTAAVCQWMRVGDVVTVSGSVQIDPTAAAGTFSELGMSLPVASNFTTGSQLGGSGGGTAIDANGPLRCLADSTNDRASFTFLANATPTSTFGFSFTYLVL